MSRPRELRCLLGFLSVLPLLAACDDDGSRAKPVPSSHGGKAPGTSSGINGNAGNDDEPGAGSGDAGEGIAADGGAGGPFAPGPPSGEPVDTSAVAKFSTGIDPSQQLDTLSPSEITAACQRYQNYMVDEIPRPAAESAACFYDDARSSRTALECAALVDDCRSTTVFMPDACPLDGLSESSTCTATVDDFEGCVTEIAAVTDAFVGYYTCDLVGATTLIEPPQPLTASSIACSVLYTECPGLE